MHPIHPHIIHPKYRPDIDGLRAVAIISVVIFHAFPDLLMGGFIGVDIFFVISGFLISSIIFSSLERQRFSIVEFYVRRIRRIFPALLLVMLACIILGWFVLFADEYMHLGRHLTAGVEFISNFVLWRESGYFDSRALTKPLLHLWSLAIEEQFYVFWPLLLAFVWKRNFGFLKVTFAIAILSFFANIYLIGSHPVAAYFLPVSRFWELMLGGVLAHMQLHHPEMLKKHSNCQSILGFSLILIGLFTINELREFPGWWALLPTFGSIFVISAGPEAWLNKKLLSNATMVWLGLVSYPLYLWHWPILSFLNITQVGQAEVEYRVIAITLALILAWATYKYLEQPVKLIKNKRRSAVWLIVLMCGLFGIGIAIQHGILAARLDTPSLHEIIKARNDWDVESGFSKYHFEREIFRRSNLGKTDLTVLLGDSHVDQYSSRISYLMHEQPDKLNEILFATHEGCLPIPGVFSESGGKRECNDYRQSMKSILENNNIKTVVIGACWSCYLIPHSKGQQQIEYRNKPEQKKKALELLKEFLIQTGKTKKVYLVIDNPIGAEFSPDYYIQGDRFTRLIVRPIPKAVLVSEEQLELRRQLRIVANLANAKIIDPFDSLCNGNNLCLVSGADDKPIYKDGNHLRASFVMQNASFIDNALLSKQ